ncbi:PaaI family thioesterase [Allopusillimonas soli]|uniref:PaaI family thioesterase n=1 Tax=Allopusillimonas soli TaxID=659016 RepID=A0A853FAF6_9BURK|nr:PaaI family thioesterase [Allopusillimonas soli]NYT37695.1 PaaI family thioesterase [Allopusillimonas soli]TEA74353.1 PaaI family thioesterase [Allopusillimonas soli]
MTTPMSMEAMQERLDKSPFNSFLGLKVVSADHEKQVIAMEMALRPEFERTADSGQFHGGIISAAIDAVGQYVAMMMVGKPLATINFRTDYLRPAINTRLHATGRVCRLGKTICVSDVEIHDDAGKLVAIGRANYATPA